MIGAEGGVDRPRGPTGVDFAAGGKRKAGEPWLVVAEGAAVSAAANLKRKKSNENRQSQA